jgi:rSAM/selenodomain-associated transferase 2/rSAM/selenodomain-associated transferase 1
MPSAPLATVVIPVWRDRDALAGLLGSLEPTDAVEVVVGVPSGEGAAFRDLRHAGGPVTIAEAPRGRAAQMNAAAARAAGRWLVFLHADSRLPADWLDVIRQADAEPSTAGGAFRFALDSGDLRARVLERGVALRVRLLQLPYGDQGIFVRHAVFDRLGGFADLPIMEDVDFVRRLRGAGALLFARSPVTTSARRWEREGWLRRSLSNLALMARYTLGASPARLAQRYFRRRRAALVVMARAPWVEGKTRIQGIDPQAHAALREALLLDTLEASRAFGAADHVVACDPPGEIEAMRRLAGEAADVFAQRGSSLGERMAHAFEDAFRLGYEAVLLVGSDLPDLPPAPLESALGRLSGGTDCVVLGPASDGGYYLIGLSRPHTALFERIPWSTSAVLAQTRAAAARLGLPVYEVDEWRDVDSLRDLDRLRDAASSGARRTRAWIARHRDAQAPR